VKEYLSQRNIPFTDRDVLEDEQALKELEALGVMTTPIVVIDGEVIIGFNRKRLEELLGS
jgi:glutaredoxin 3